MKPAYEPAAPGEDGTLHNMGGVAGRVESLIAPAVTEMGYGIVRVALFGKQNPTLQIMIERLDEAPVSVEDCARTSRTVSVILDAADPVGEAWTLEVSSPGIDRPLTRLQDFARFSGLAAKVEMAAPVDGRRRFIGRILGISGEDVRLETTLAGAAEPVEIALPFRDIRQARLAVSGDVEVAAGPGGRQPGSHSR